MKKNPTTDKEKKKKIQQRQEQKRFNDILSVPRTAKFRNRQNKRQKSRCLRTRNVYALYNNGQVFFYYFPLFLLRLRQICFEKRRTRTAHKTRAGYET